MYKYTTCGLTNKQTKKKKAIKEQLERKIRERMTDQKKKKKNDGFLSGDSFALDLYVSCFCT